MSIDNAMIYGDQQFVASAPHEEFGSGAVDESYDPFASSAMHKQVSASSALVSAPSRSVGDSEHVQGDRLEHDEVKYAKHEQQPGDSVVDTPVPEYNREEEEADKDEEFLQKEDTVHDLVAAQAEDDAKTEVGSEVGFKHHSHNFSFVFDEGKTFSEEDYLSLKKNVDELALLAKSIQLRGKEFVTRARALAETSFNSAQEFQKFYSSTESDFSRVSVPREQASGQIRFDVVRHIEEYEYENLDKPMTAWLEEYGRLTWKCEQRNAAYARLQHYINKVEKLDAAEMRMREKGKPLPLKAADRIKRNQHKLQVARDEFTSLNMGLCTELSSVWRNRLKIVDPAFKTLAEIELIFYDKANNNHNAISNEIRRVELKERGKLQEGLQLKFEYTPDDQPEPQAKKPWWRSTFKLR
eukprot:TRINITY_DN1218_c0_g1_i1.p1 TRINITY_DN1218_c0_g1~~TRINITY_DN1218_c0_g1_i1.p1  ORF type:complete len:425 (-),score=113.88 TRINITY_DN1218_c0_g1_i1:81-1313(-)